MKAPFLIYKDPNSVVPIVEINNRDILENIYYSEESPFDEEWTEENCKTLPKRVFISRFSHLIDDFKIRIESPEQTSNEEEERIEELFLKFCQEIIQNLKEFETTVKAARKKDFLPAEMLPLVFQKGDEVVLLENDVHQGAIIESVSLVQTMIMGQFIQIEYNIIENDGKSYVMTRKNKIINCYEGERHLSLVGISFMTKKEKKELQKQGQKYVELTQKPHYKSYKGNLVRQSYFGSYSFSSNGRIMIDLKSLLQMDPNYKNYINIDVVSHETMQDVPNDKLHICGTVLYGFSFSCKKWGEFSINDISSIDFKKDAIDKLVLDEETKKMVISLVKHSKNKFSDIIDGKGGGSIFVLHGSTGTGKTLTAEAVAEYLEKPLYSISVGELGTDPQQLEKNLRMILDMATNWNSVILLDEADIFLEKRDGKNITRNAMVGIFLRLLEYHQGVLFLTTNRIKKIDPAFHSRISIPILYQEHDANARKQIWINLLDSAKITHLTEENLEELSALNINGRQIKNAIRMAMALAEDDNKGFVELKHLMAPLKSTLKFNEMIQKK